MYLKIFGTARLTAGIVLIWEQEDTTKIQNCARDQLEKLNPHHINVLGMNIIHSLRSET